MNIRQKFGIGFVAIGLVAVALVVGVRLLGKAARFHYLEREHLALILKVQHALDLAEEGGPRSSQVSRPELLEAVSEARRIAGSVESELFPPEIAAFRLLGFSAVVDLPAEAFERLTRIQGALVSDTASAVSREMADRIRADVEACREAGDRFGPLVLEASDFVKTTVLWLNLAGVLVIVGTFLLVRRATLEPLGLAVGAAQRIAAGDLGGGPLPRSDDEVGQLMAALDEMKESLGNVVGQVRERAQAVAASMAEIARAAGDLSGRTESQAATLQGTAANLSEIRQSARRIGDQSRAADRQANVAGSIAADGGEAVSVVMRRMQETLEASHRVAEINGVVNDIAFQTNVLALNAAVEAARAGEDGRGFGVVAGEVRNLAQRSAGAATEIAQLIAHTTGRIQAGADDVGHAGQTIARVVDSVGQVSRLVAEVAQQVTHQEGSIVQIDESMRALDQGTQSNAAMAEQSAAAASSAAEQADLLVQVVGRFKLPG